VTASQPSGMRGNDACIELRFKASVTASQTVRHAELVPFLKSTRLHMQCMFAKPSQQSAELRSSERRIFKVWCLHSIRLSTREQWTEHWMMQGQEDACVGRGKYTPQSDPLVSLLLPSSGTGIFRPS
jgi:hypothetical protein